MRYFAIGDIHGHYDELIHLLRKISIEGNFDPEEDHLVLCGDLVDNGPKTKEVIDWCIETKKNYPDTFHPLKGNHDEMMVDALLHNSKLYGDYYIWWNQGGRQTLESYKTEDMSDLDFATSQPLDYIPKEHLDFLENLPAFYDTPDYFFVHGGIRPGVPLDQQKEEDLLWIRSEFYNYPETFPKTIVFAHTPFEDHTNMDPEVVKYTVMDKPDRIGLNTMPRNFGHLTAVELPERKFYTSL